MEDTQVMGGFERLSDLKCKLETLFDGNCASLEPLGEGLALYELGDEKRHAIEFFEAVESRNSRVIERAQRARRHLDAREPLTVARDCQRKRPNPHFATATRIMGTPQLALPGR
jgi:hypothetical protein